MNLKVISMVVVKFIGANSPKILTALSVIGTGLAVVEAVKATADSVEVIKEQEEIINRELTIKETVKLCWKRYVPTVIMATTSAACGIGSHCISEKRAAALATLWSISQKSAEEYKNKVIETLGENKHNKIMDGIAEDQAKNFIFKNGQDNEIYDPGEVIFYDPKFGREFKGTVQDVRNAALDCREKSLVNMECSYNEFCYNVGIKPIDLGDYLGWTPDRPFELRIPSATMMNGRPVAILQYDIYSLDSRRKL